MKLSKLLILLFLLALISCQKKSDTVSIFRATGNTCLVVKETYNGCNHISDVYKTDCPADMK